MVTTQTQPEREWMSLTDLARELGMARATVQRWARTGYMPTHRPGKEYRIRRSELEAWLESKRTLGEGSL